MNEETFVQSINDIWDGSPEGPSSHWYTIARIAKEGAKNTSRNAETRLHSYLLMIKLLEKACHHKYEGPGEPWKPSTEEPSRVFSPL